MNKIIIAVFLILGIILYIASHKTDDFIVSWCRCAAGLLLIVIGVVGWLVS